MDTESSTVITIEIDKEVSPARIFDESVLLIASTLLRVNGVSEERITELTRDYYMASTTEEMTEYLGFFDMGHVDADYIAR